MTMSPVSLLVPDYYHFSFEKVSKSMFSSIQCRVNLRSAIQLLISDWFLKEGKWWITLYYFRIHSIRWLWYICSCNSILLCSFWIWSKSWASKVKAKAKLFSGFRIQDYVKPKSKSNYEITNYYIITSFFHSFDTFGFACWSCWPLIFNVGYFDTPKFWHSIFWQ